MSDPRRRAAHPPGVGKSHIATAIAVGAIRAGRRALVRSTFDLPADFAQADATGARRDVVQHLILAFAERVLPRAADLWVQASLEQRRRFQQLFFTDGIAFDGNDFVRTRVTAPAFSYLRTIEDGNERLVDQTGVEPVQA